MPQAEIIDCVNFMPERVVRNDELAAALPKESKDGKIESNAFFHGVGERRFASPEYTSGRLGALACKRLLDRNGVAGESIDCIITACVLTDLLANGIGADVQHAIGASGANILNVDTNCTSWFASVKVARAFIESGLYKRVLIVTVTNFVSRLGDYQKSKRSWTLGDGASATLMVAGDRASILGTYERTIGELYGHMRLEPDAAPDGCYRQYWEGGRGALTVNFSDELLERIRKTATEVVPEAIRTVLATSELTVDDVNMLITHQPNRLFIDGWREALGVQPPRAHDTLDIYGNLFMGSIPVTLADGIERGLIKRGDVIAAATFANAGDHIAAMTLRW